MAGAASLTPLGSWRWVCICSGSYAVFRICHVKSLSDKTTATPKDEPDILGYQPPSGRSISLARASEYSCNMRENWGPRLSLVYLDGNEIYLKAVAVSNHPLLSRNRIPCAITLLSECLTCTFLIVAASQQFSVSSLYLLLLSAVPGDFFSVLYKPYLSCRAYPIRDICDWVDYIYYAGHTVVLKILTVKVSHFTSTDWLARSKII